MPFQPEATGLTVTPTTKDNTLWSIDSSKQLDLRQIIYLRGDLMRVLIYLGQRSTGGGTMRYIYGYSTYQRMTEKELAACQESHPADFDGKNSII